VPIKRILAPRIDFSVLRREFKLPGEFPAEAMAEADAAAGGTAMPAVAWRGWSKRDSSVIPYVRF
jgi:hypothetical protein